MNFSIPGNALAAAVALALATPAASAQTVYSQPFNIGVAEPAGCHREGFPGGAGTYPFPTDMLLFNVDNRTPAGTVAYINEAWEVREDFNFDVAQCGAFSTSWYSPAGQADDWMWTPAISVPTGAQLSWRAVAYDPAYPDGYEVRVLDEPPTTANLLDSIVVFSTAAEASAWTPHSVSLSAYAGQSIHIGFRNNSTDKFVLVVDDVEVKPTVVDLALSTDAPLSSEYARAPTGFEMPATVAATLANAGLGALTNVTGSATVKLDGAATVASVAADPIASIAEGASVDAVFATELAFSGDGAWSVEYSFSASETETDLANNVFEAAGPVIGGDELARYQGVPSNTFGIGADNGGELGVAFTLTQDASFSGARFGMGAIPPDNGDDPPVPNACPGFNYVLNLRAFDSVAGEPGALIDTTVPVPCNYNEGGVYDVEFVNGPHLLTAGTYVLTAVEPVGGPTLPLLMHMQRYTPGTGWAIWPSIPGGGWANMETFGATFARTPELSLLVALPELPIFQDGFELVASKQVRRSPAPAIVQGHPTRSVAPTQLATPR